MVNNAKGHLFFILALIFGAIFVLLPNIGKDNLPDWYPGKPVKLGLDLRGGAYLVMKVVTDDAVKNRLSSVATSLRTELKSQGIPVIRSKQDGDKILEVTLLNDSKVDGDGGLRDLVRRDYPDLNEVGIRREGRAVVRYEINTSVAEKIKHESVDQAVDVIRSRIDLNGVLEPIIQRVGEELIMVQLPDVEEEKVKEIKATISKVAKLEFRLVANKDVESSENAGVAVKSFKMKGGGDIQLEDTVLMAGDAIKNARVDFSSDRGGLRSLESEVSFELTSVGARAFAQITSENVGRQLAIVLDGIVQSSPNIQGPITGGSGVITGRFNEKEAHQLAVVLRSGALPAAIRVDTESRVGASLGADAIRKGFISLFVGSLAVVVFILWYYKKSGLLAIVGLFFNVLMLLSLLSLLDATLTLPGIAGLVLTVAICLDANVIIFERIKEEIANGVSPGAAIEAGFSRAHWTVMDSNITTFMTALFLFMFVTTGPVKGFAVTLCIGIVTSLFTALYVARVLFSLMPLRKRGGALSI